RIKSVIRKGAESLKVKVPASITINCLMELFEQQLFSMTFNIWNDIKKVRHNTCDSSAYHALVDSTNGLQMTSLSSTNAAEEDFEHKKL
ncbi:hypothetical protein AVEN_156007-1, partial [Araneus ventricosus]